MILGASILQLPAIQKAVDMGLRVIVIDADSEAIGFKEKKIIRKQISTIDTENILKIAKEYKIDGIMTVASDMPIQSISYVVEELGLAGIRKEKALKATNKVMMRECLKDHQVPIPVFCKVNTKYEYQEAVKKFKSKCIVKPADNSGSRGVYLLSDLSDKIAINKAFEYSKQFSRNGDLIIEEYMEGPEVSVEILSIDGICHVIQITDKLTTGAPYFVEMGHNEPSLLPSDIKKKIVEVAIASAKAIGITNGPSHVEIKITKEGPKIVEIGARLGGDNITTHLIPLSTGIDLVKCCIQIALGEKPCIQRKINKGAAIRYFKSELGIIKDITGIEKVKAIKGIKQVTVTHSIGQRVTETKSSADRIGFVIAQNDNVEEAIKISERAMSLIEFVVSE